MSAVSNAGLPVDFKFSIGRADNVSALYNLFVFRSMPFFLLGIAMRLYEQRIKNVELFSKRNLVICMLVGAILSVLERLLLGDIQIFIGTFLLVFAVFAYCIKYPDGINGLFEKVGTSLSMYVYVIHVSVMESVNWLGKLIGIYETSVFQWMRPVIVIAISLLCAALVYRFSVRANKKRKSVIR